MKTEEQLYQLTKELTIRGRKLKPGRQIPLNSAQAKTYADSIAPLATYQVNEGGNWIAGAIRRAGATVQLTADDAQKFADFITALESPTK